jgi:hypothetical protein
VKVEQVCYYVMKQAQAQLDKHLTDEVAEIQNWRL